jgi:hypothetical protein
MTKVSRLHRFPGFRRFLWASGLGMGLLVVGAIAPPPPPSSAEADPPLLRSLGGPQLVEALSQLNLFWQAIVPLSPTATSPDAQRVWVTQYGINTNCDGFEAQGELLVSPDRLDGLVGQLLQAPQQAVNALDLTGYRVQRAPDSSTVTIDFRIAPDSPRQLVSLSACEQMMLLGSLRQTLLENPALGIDTVRFSDRGEPLRL